MKKVSIITVNFNQPRVTEELLQSVHKTNTYANIEIIVVDNGSKTNCVPAWKEKYPWATFVRSDTNLGFAGGNNLAVRQAAGDYLFLVNNDTEFTNGLVSTLANTLDTHPEIGMVSPKIRYFDKPGMLQYAGFTKMNYYTARNACIGQFEADNGQHDKLTGETSFAHGAAMMVRKEAIERAGLMPENYFLYYEEMDWCERIRKAGYKIWVNMQALIYHKESVSVGGRSELKEYFMTRNRLLFVRRNCPLAKKIVFWPYFTLVVGTRNIAGYLRRREWNFVSAFVKGIAWNITNNVNSPRLGIKI